MNQPNSFAGLHMNSNSHLSPRLHDKYKMVTKEAAIASFNKLDAEFEGYISYCGTIAALFELMDGTSIFYFVENGSIEYSEAADAIWMKARCGKAGQQKSVPVSRTTSAD